MVGSMETDLGRGQLSFAHPGTEFCLAALWQGNSKGRFIRNAGYVGLVLLLQWIHTGWA